MNNRGFNITVKTLYGAVAIGGALLILALAVAPIVYDALYEVLLWRVIAPDITLTLRGDGYVEVSIVVKRTGGAPESSIIVFIGQDALALEGYIDVCMSSVPYSVSGSAKLETSGPVFQLSGKLETIDSPVYMALEFVESYINLASPGETSKIEFRLYSAGGQLIDYAYRVIEKTTYAGAGYLNVESLSLKTIEQGPDFIMARLEFKPSKPVYNGEQPNLKLLEISGRYIANDCKIELYIDVEGGLKDVSPILLSMVSQERLPPGYREIYILVKSLVTDFDVETPSELELSILKGRASLKIPPLVYTQNEGVDTTAAIARSFLDAGLPGDTKIRVVVLGSSGETVREYVATLDEIISERG